MDKAGKKSAIFHKTIATHCKILLVQGHKQYNLENQDSTSNKEKTQLLWKRNSEADKTFIFYLQI